MRAPLACLLPLLAACADAGDDDTAPGAPACPSDWTDAGDGVVLDPARCLAWSARGALEMDWYAAVTPEEARAGGCDADCDTGDDGYCADLAPAGGVTAWRVPAFDEIHGASFDAVPLEPLDGALWSRDTDPAMDGMALRSDLSVPGATLSAGKSQPSWVRCVADLE